jgi:ADP-ribose pyrophosphatase YjhB (NUDIX family)
MAADLFAFCPACGREGMTCHPPREHCCDACGYRFFFNAAAAAGAIITCGEQLLFGVRKREPQAGKWDLVGGFIDFDESAEAGLCREIREELGLTVQPADLSYVGSEPNDYLYDGVPYRTLDLIFHLDLDARPALTPADDLAGVVWVKGADVDEEQLAFDSTRRALRGFLTNGWRQAPR